MYPSPLGLGQALLFLIASLCSGSKTPTRKWKPACILPKERCRNVADSTSRRFTLPLTASLEERRLTVWSAVNDSQRRTCISSLLSLPIVSNTGIARAVSPLDSTASSTELETGLLNSRVTENLMSAPSYGMEASDITYPSWFAGTWKVVSTTQDVQAPAGVALFGGNRTYATARNEIGTTLTYESRFVSNPGSESTTVADREFNVRSIVKASMGSSAVLDFPYVSPNKITCILAPVGSPNVLRATLLTLNRRQETVSDTEFDCSEVVHELVAPASSTAGAPAPPRILKQIETTSLYKYDPKRDKVVCRQRSASFLQPSQQDPTAMAMWQASRGRPVDVRFYDVEYTRR